MPARGKSTARCGAPEPVHQVPVQLPAAGCTTNPAGLLTTSVYARLRTRWEVHGLRREGLTLRCGLEFDFNTLPGRHFARSRVHAHAIHADQTRFDQRFQITAGKIGHQGHEEHIKALTGYRPAPLPLVAANLVQGQILLRCRPANRPLQGQRRAEAPQLARGWNVSPSGASILVHRRAFAPFFSGALLHLRSREIAEDDCFSRAASAALLVLATVLTTGCETTPQDRVCRHQS